MVERRERSMMSGGCWRSEIDESQNLHTIGMAKDMEEVPFSYYF